MNHIKIRQEVRRLKEKDKLENYERNRRQNVSFLKGMFCEFKLKKLFKLQKLLDKEKIVEDKLQQRRIEEEVLKKAKMWRFFF